MFTHQRVIPFLRVKFSRLVSIAILFNGTYTNNYNEHAEHSSNYSLFLLLSPRIGPAGTAICAYRADNSYTPSGTGGRNMGIFDIFREDIRVNGVNGAAGHEEENMFIEVGSCCMK